MPDTVEATAEDLAWRVGKKGVTNAQIDDAFATAVELVDDAFKNAFRPLKPFTRKECILSVGYAVYDRNKSSHGVGQLTQAEGSAPVRAPRDPLASIQTIINQHVIGLA